MRARNSERKLNPQTIRAKPNNPDMLIASKKMLQPRFSTSVFSLSSRLRFSRTASVEVLGTEAVFRARNSSEIAALLRATSTLAFLRNSFFSSFFAIKIYKIVELTRKLISCQKYYTINFTKVKKNFYKIL